MRVLLSTVVSLLDLWRLQREHVLFNKRRQKVNDVHFVSWMQTHTTAVPQILQLLSWKSWRFIKQNFNIQKSWLYKVNRQLWVRIFTICWLFVGSILKLGRFIARGLEKVQSRKRNWMRRWCIFFYKRSSVVLPKYSTVSGV